ncbi:MAG: hypothetical protein H6711_17900 [Myxococcales bacterium]|nr:hypothetical protein [Myxococcales bacterium]
MALQVSVDEGHALEVLDLLCRGRPIRITPEAPITRPRRELVELAARRLGVVCLRALVQGGIDERAVLRGGRRQRGRIWDRELNAGLRLRFTAASHELWIQLCARFAEIARQAQVVEGEGSTRAARRQIRRIVKVADTDTGDWLFFALAARNLERAPMPGEIRDDLIRRLAMGSPLATLVALSVDRDEIHGLVDHLGGLLDADAVRLLECSGPLLVDAWVARVSRLGRAPGPERRARTLAAADVLEAHLEVLDRAGRLDLAGPIVDALVRLLDGPWSARPSEIAEALGGRRDFETLADRDAHRRAYARLPGIGLRLLALRDALAREAYGDPRYEEAQLLLELCEPLRAREGALAALAGALTNRLG